MRNPPGPLNRRNPSWSSCEPRAATGPRVSRRADGHLSSVLGFTIAAGKVVEIDILADPVRLSRRDLSAIDR
jgi:hypothetical protein